MGVGEVVHPSKNSLTWQVKPGRTSSPAICSALAKDPHVLTRAIDGDDPLIRIHDPDRPHAVVQIVQDLLRDARVRVAGRDDFDRQIGHDLSELVGQFRKPFPTPVGDVGPSHRVRVPLGNHARIVHRDPAELVFLARIGRSIAQTVNTTYTMSRTRRRHLDQLPSNEFVLRPVRRLRHAGEFLGRHELFSRRHTGSVPCRRARGQGGGKE